MGESARSADRPATDETSLLADVVDAFGAEQRRALGLAAIFRCATMAIGALLMGAAYLTTGRTFWLSFFWWGSWVYGACNVALVAVRRHPRVLEAGLAVAVLDVVWLTLTQLRSMPHAYSAGAVAGFSLGYFAILLGVNAIYLRPPAILALAVLSSACEEILCRTAHVGGPTSANAAVLLLASSGLLYLVKARAARVVSSAVQTAERLQAERRRAGWEERRRTTAETRAEEARLEAERLQRLQDQKDRLTQLLVHDLRSPLSTVTIVLDHARIAVAEQQRERATDDLELAVEGVARLADMVGEMLMLTRLEDSALPLRREPVPVRPLLEAVARAARRLAADGEHPVEVDAHEDLTVPADPALLRRILENLAGNAVRHSPARQPARLHARRDGDSLCISVQNQGTPIPPELRDRLFQKYQQGERRAGGAGLGLYFCRLAAEAHGGRVALEDEPGWAVTMRVRLPLFLHARTARGEAVAPASA